MYLFLSPRHHHGTLSNIREVALGESGDEVVRIAQTGCYHDIFIDTCGKQNEYEINYDKEDMRAEEDLVTENCDVRHYII